MEANNIFEWYMMMETIRGEILNKIQQLKSLKCNENDFKSYIEYDTKSKSKSNLIDTLNDSLRQYDYYLSNI